MRHARLSRPGMHNIRSVTTQVVWVDGPTLKAPVLLEDLPLVCQFLDTNYKWTKGRISVKHV